MIDLPELESSRLGREHAAAARPGELTLQQCRECGAVQYPFRELCGDCLSGELHWRAVGRSGTVIAIVHVHASRHPFFRESAPWPVCSVQLEAGPRVIAHAADATIESGSRVDVSDERAGPSRYVLVARAGDPSTQSPEKP